MRTNLMPFEPDWYFVCCYATVFDHGVSIPAEEASCPDNLVYAGSQGLRFHG
jgi:hypothetical protein